MKKVRESNFELLRIISIFLIICFHYSDLGSIELSSVPFSFNKFILELASFGGGFGNNIFILISGYFLLNSENTNMKKVINLFIQTLFYSITLGLVAIKLNLININLSNIIRIIFPFSPNDYWYISIFIILMLLVPYLNKVIANTTKSQLKKLILILLVLFSIVPTIAMIENIYISLGAFVTLYFIGAYIRKYSNKKFENIKKTLLLSIIWFLICVILTILCDINGFDKINSFVWPMFRTPILFLSISVFLLFKNIKIKNNKFINYVASTTFGIYLIHMNPNIWKLIWRVFFDNSIYFYKLNFPIIMFIQCSIVFIVCSVIEMIRNKIFKMFIKNI